jgi:hypothetical protein
MAPESVVRAVELTSSASANESEGTSAPVEQSTATEIAIEASITRSAIESATAIATAPPPFAHCHCLRCGHDWTPRRPTRRPNSCARCNSHGWDRPPLRPFARRPEDPPNPNWVLRSRTSKIPCPTCGKLWRRQTAKEKKAELQRKDDGAAATTRLPDGTIMPATSASELYPFTGGGTVPLPGYPKNPVVLQPPHVRQLTPPPGLGLSLSEELKSKGK